MEDSMVTGRMPQKKKEAGNDVLQRAGLSASAAINRMYDLLIENGNADFLNPPARVFSKKDWANAASYVQSLKLPFSVDDRFENMTKAQVKAERLAQKGLM